MVKVQVKYQRSEKLKMARRPKRIRNRLNRACRRTVQQRAAKSWRSRDAQKFLGGRRENAGLVKGRSNVGGEEEIVKFEAGAEGEQQDQFADITGVGQAVEASRDCDELVAVGALDRRCDGSS